MHRDEIGGVGNQKSGQVDDEERRYRENEVMSEIEACSSSYILFPAKAKEMKFTETFLSKMVILKVSHASPN